MGPLSGLVVIDFSTLVPGPLATLMLAEAGAEVIKIEPPAGDPMRDYAPAWSGVSGNYALLNRGKQTVTADLKNPDDHAAVMALARRADILVEQFRPGTMERLGLGYATLAAGNPALIYCSLSSYGQTGPRAQQAGHDLNFLAESGFLSLAMGRADDPVQPATPIGDVGGGSYPAVINILLAVLERRRTGRGTHLDIAMAENVFPFMYWALSQGFATGRWPGDRDALVTGASPRYRLYATRDGQVLAVAALEPKFWTAFCDLIALPDSLRDDSIDPAATMVAVAGKVAADDGATWARRLADVDCCCSLVRGVAAGISDRQVEARKVFAGQVESGGGERLPALPVPIVRGFRAAASDVRPIPERVPIRSLGKKP